MKAVTFILFLQISYLQNLLCIESVKEKTATIKDSIKFSGINNPDNSFANNCRIKGNPYPLKRVLIITGNCNDSIMAVAAGNELYNLLGHFNTSIDILNNKNYNPGTIKNYNVLFYIGLQQNDSPSAALMNDIYKSNKTIVWINSGLSSYEKAIDVKRKLGFAVSGIDRSGTYNTVKFCNKIFTREGNDIYQVQIVNKNTAKIVATAVGDLQGKILPYIVKSKNLYYIADIPFFNSSANDRYLLFADILHDIMKEYHPVEHKAIVRIEDVTPIRDPERLRKIADILSERNIPFLIGVVPFFVDPGANVYISLSEKPKLVAALKYCVSKGGSIVLHGVTHQYKGVSGIDYEFWDGSINKPIANETPAEIENKIEEGINECVKNGIYPLIWETPHYTASVETYKIVSRHFGSVIERLIVTNNFKYGQFFPYNIHNDIYGQKVYPEDLGYMPIIQNRDSSEIYVKSIIRNAKGLLNVRDGCASFFFHTFVDLDYLKEIADGISSLGYKFVDLRKETNWVKTNDIVILSGSQKYTLSPEGHHLAEVYYNKSGKVEKRIVSDVSANGIISKYIILKPDEYYVAVKTPEQLTSEVAEVKNNNNILGLNSNDMSINKHIKN